MISTLSLNTTTRIQSIDLLRGLVMALMAIDHVRVYSGLPAGGSEAGIFFTRWITHFCAPAFTFFAGTSAFLYGAKINDKAKLTRYLITRGFLLVILELTVIRFFWAFHVSTDFILAGVIWMLGWCMVLLAAFVWLKPYAVAAIGVAVILSQTLFGKVPYWFPENLQASFGKVWEFIYPSGFETLNGVSVLYSIVPWIGVMAAGYGFGAIVKMDVRQQRKVCLITGLSMIALFIVIGTVQILATPSADELPFLLQLLNQQKYPASILFVFMTIGPIMALVPWAEKTKGWFSRALIVIGRVPLFYYLLHILVIHTSALVVQLILDGSMHHDWFLYAPYVNIEPEFRWSLWLLYFVFIIDIVLLYFFCCWYERYKLNHPEKKWFKYI
jgi:uncharacterized membrane protein